MRKYQLMILAIGTISLVLSGCGKKEPNLEQNQEPAVMDEAMNVSSEQGAVSVPAGSSQQSAPVVSAQETAAVEMQQQAIAPADNYKPSSEEIQAALKNAGLYSGEVDGKVGPKTKKAIEDFQKANGLKADGIVGKKTWALLSRYLGAPSVSVSSSDMTVASPVGSETAKQ